MKNNFRTTAVDKFRGIFTICYCNQMNAKSNIDVTNFLQINQHTLSPFGPAFPAIPCSPLGPAGPAGPGFLAAPSYK